MAESSRATIGTSARPMRSCRSYDSIAISGMIGGSLARRAPAIGFSRVESHPELGPGERFEPTCVDNYGTRVPKSPSMS